MPFRRKLLLWVYFYCNALCSTQVRVKKFVPIIIVDIRMEVYYTYVNPTPMSLLVNLVSSSDGNDIGVGLT